MAVSGRNCGVRGAIAAAMEIQRQELRNAEREECRRNRWCVAAIRSASLRQSAIAGASLREGMHSGSMGCIALQ